MATLRSLSKDREGAEGVVSFASQWGLEEQGRRLMPIPQYPIWSAWDALLQEPWESVSTHTNPRAVSSSHLIKLATYNSWFACMESEAGADGEQENLKCVPRYIKHTGGIPFAYVKQLMKLRTGAHHLAIETGRWSRPRVPRAHRLCTKCSHTVVEDELHLLFECPAYHHIRLKYKDDLFAEYGGIERAASTMKHVPGKLREFMDQEPALQVAKFVFECLEFRRHEAEDLVPYFDLSHEGEGLQGPVFDTFSSGRNVDESPSDLSSSMIDTGMYAHGA